MNKLPPEEPEARATGSSRIVATPLGHAAAPTLLPSDNTEACSIVCLPNIVTVNYQHHFLHSQTVLMLVGSMLATAEIFFGSISSPRRLTTCPRYAAEVANRVHLLALQLS